MAVAIWNRSGFVLTSPAGSVTLNADSGARFLLDPSQCSASIAALRSASIEIPQGDGMIFNPRFKDGYQMSLGLILLEDGAPAFDADLQAMYDEIALHLEAMIYGDGRLQWTVPGGNDRMLDRCRTLTIPPSPSGTRPKTMSFAVESPFPYAMDAPQTTTDLTDGTPALLARGGTAERFFPVLQVDGPFDGFTFQNVDAGLEYVYDDSLPGAVAVAGGDYAEVDFFAGTITKNGDVSYLFEGVDVLNSQRVWMGRDAQEYELTGASGRLLWQSAWA